MIYYIYYHSANPDQNNRKIVDFIKTFKGWAILSPSFFMVVKETVKDDDTDTNLLYIKSKLKELGSINDEFFIGQIGNESIWQGYGERLRDWLIKYSREFNVEEREQFSNKEIIAAAQNELSTIQKSNQQTLSEALPPADPVKKEEYEASYRK